jgi:hypothetical protein
MTVGPVGPGTSQFYNPLEAQLAQTFGMNGAFGADTTADTLIYLGDDYADYPGVPDYLLKPGSRQSTGMVTVDNATAEWWSLDNQQKNRFLDAVQGYAGYRPDGEQGFSEWKKIVGYTGMYSSSTGKNISPFQFAEMQAERNPAQARAGAYTGPTTTSYREENVNLTDPSNARALIDNAIGSYLGRKPSSKEYKTFLQALNATEEANPQISERVTRSSGSANPASQTVSTKGKSMGGVSGQQFAKEYAKSDEQYAETQLSTTGLQSFLSMLG